MVRFPFSPRHAAAASSSDGEPLRLHIYRLLRKGLVVIIVVCIVNLIFSFVFRTPKANRIAAERDELLLRMEALDDRIRAAQLRVDELHARDVNVYRPLFGVDSLHIAGIYTSYPDSVYRSLASRPFGDRIVASWQTLDALTRRLYLQSRSLDTLQLMASDKEKMATAIPAIWPIDKRNLRNSLGAYGGRFHPIYKRYIKHEGLDMPAHIGDPVYATGNGVVRSVDNGLRSRGLRQADPDRPRLRLPDPLCPPLAHRRPSRPGDPARRTDRLRRQYGRFDRCPPPLRGNLSGPYGQSDQLLPP